MGKYTLILDLLSGAPMHGFVQCAWSTVSVTYWEKTNGVRIFARLVCRGPAILYNTFELVLKYSKFLHSSQISWRAPQNSPWLCSYEIKKTFEIAARPLSGDGRQTCWQFKWYKSLSSHIIHVASRQQPTKDEIKILWWKFWTSLDCSEIQNCLTL